MNIVHIRTLCGPNVFADFPVLRMRLDLGARTETSSVDMPGFTDRLLAALPGLSEHRCSRGRPGGFVERLREGTYLAHIVEHVALELSDPAGLSVTFGKTIWAGSPGLYDVAVEFENEAGMRIVLEAAVELVMAVIEEREYDVRPRIEEAREAAEDTALGPSTGAVVRAAEARGIPWARLNDQSLIVFGWGKHRKFIQATTTSQTNFVAVEIAGDKQLTKELLDRASIPTPRGVVVRTADEAVKALDEIGPPVAIKPLDGNQGKGVSLSITTEEEARRAFDIAREYRSRVLVEKMIEGKNYRVIVVGGRMVAASERMPAHVVGDGVHTVTELVEIENKNPLRAVGHSGALTKIEIDDVVRAFLDGRKRTLEEIPAKGEVFLLRESANLSTGGTARDVTGEVHPATAHACERAARAIGLDVCGIDLVTDDIREPLSKSGAIIELNAAPGIRMHQHPSAGKPRDVGAAIVELLYPKGAPSRIPTASVTGTNGKTTTTRMIGHVMGSTGLVVGMTTTDGIYIGGHCIDRGDTTGPQSARTILFDPTVEFAALETARGGILRRGLGYDWSDVGVLTNIQPDHLGQDGLETLDDLLWVKMVVAERVREGGTLILNAEDPLLAELPSHRRIAKRPKRIAFFSLDPAHPVLARHLAAGGIGYTVHRGYLVERIGSSEERLVRADEIPATFGGVATFQVANALAAAAACRAHGVSAGAIAAALRSFGDAEQNPGRMNLYRTERGHVLLDYGHNPASYRAVCATLARWNGHRRLTGVISAPGDRMDEVVSQSARELARVLHRLIIKEDRDRRGRAPGEVAGTLHQAALGERPQLECEVILDEVAAIQRALDTMVQGEICAIFTDDIDGTRDTLVSMGAVATTTFDHGSLPADELRKAS